MPKFLLATPLLALTFAAIAPPVAAQDAPTSIQVRVSNTHRNYSCHNTADTVQVTGSSDVLTITGACGSLQVTGSSNTITIDSIQTVQFTGDSNSVLYRSTHRPPTVGDEGHSNSIGRAPTQTATVGNEPVSPSAGDSDTVVSASPGSMASSVSQIAAGIAGTVQGVQTRDNMLNIILSKQRTTQNCGDGKVLNINGYQNDITLTGSCSKVTLNGWGNTIHIEEVTSIEVMGHTNTLTWQRGRSISKPVVQIDSGTDNSVRHLTLATQ